MDSSNTEETVFQYYTIINDANFFPESQEQVTLYEEEDEDGNQLMYVAFTQTDEEEDEEDGNDESTIRIENTPPVVATPFQPPAANVKIITVQNGQIFVTDSPDESHSTIQPVIRGTEHDENSSAFVEVNGEEESLDVAGDEDYQQIKFEDGSCAIINADVWNSLVENISYPKEAKKEKKFACVYVGCDKVYTTAHHLTVHMRTHTGSRPYNCNVDGCSKAFATGYSLKAHTRTHTGEKPYGCTVCLRRFKTSGDLQKHVRTHTGEKPFKCPIEGCGRSFTTSNIRKVHIRSHTGERPYSCQHPDCGKAFASATNYKNHMRIHSGEKPYVCPVEGCGKRFTEYSSLYKHNTVHQPYKPFRCSYCGQLFKQESTLKAHKRVIHNVVITDDGTELVIKQQDTNSEIIFQVSRVNPSVVQYEEEDDL